MNLSRQVHVQVLSPPEKQEGFMLEVGSTRRNFLRRTSIVGVGILSPLAVAQQKPAAKEKAEEISPAEDLMREHGVLNRILLIYDYHVHLLATKRPFDGSVLVSA